MDAETFNGAYDWIFNPSKSIGGDLSLFVQVVCALNRLERACDRRAAAAEGDAYLSQLKVPGMKESLLELDGASNEAREALRAAGMTTDHRPGSSNAWMYDPGEILADPPPKPPVSILAKSTHRYEDDGASDCVNGCGCTMGPYEASGPPGVDPHGACPKAKKAVAHA
jgi:hypothetical protein